MPAFPSTARRITTPSRPSNAQIIQVGKYDPRMFREGDALHAVNVATDVSVATARNRTVARRGENWGLGPRHEFMARYFLLLALLVRGR
jgi:hypothetical protein